MVCPWPSGRPAQAQPGPALGFTPRHLHHAESTPATLPPPPPPVRAHGQCGDRRMLEEGAVKWMTSGQMLHLRSNC